MKSGNINLLHKITTSTVNFLIPFINILFPMLTAEWLQLRVQYLCTYLYQNIIPEQNIIISFFLIFSGYLGLAKSFLGNTSIENCLQCSIHGTQSTPRVAMADFWRTFPHDGKSALAGEGGGAPPPLFILFTTTYKVAVYAPAERADTLPLFLLYLYM